MDEGLYLIPLAVFVVAVLYSSVGHGGASGYLAVMALLSVPPAQTRPSALILNLFVSSIGAMQFWRAGHFSWGLFWPFAITSIPAAYIGGMIYLPTHIYRFVLGLVLVFAAFRLGWRFSAGTSPSRPHLMICVLIGSAIGLLSGLIGVGGGIFLTPILLLMNWAETKTAAGVSALFIFVNSAAGLAGNRVQAEQLPGDVWLWVAAAIAGGITGSMLGARKFESLTLRRVLAAVLLLAGGKLIFV